MCTSVGKPLGAYELAYSYLTVSHHGQPSLISDANVCGQHTPLYSHH